MINYSKNNKLNNQSNTQLNSTWDFKNYNSSAVIFKKESKEIIVDKKEQEKVNRYNLAISLNIMIHKITNNQQFIVNLCFLSTIHKIVEISQTDIKMMMYIFDK